MASIIDGKAISTQIKDEVKAEAAALKAKGVEPCLAVVLVGEDPASQVYVRNKKRACEYCGFKSLNYELPASTTEEELLALIDKLNADKECNGILVQLPLPKHIDENKVLLRILPEKDVDGFHPYNVGLLSIGKADLKACTPAGCIELIKRSGVDITGKKCVVVGRSNIVGKPVSLLCLQKNATVTIAHSKTKNLKEVCQRADVLIAAVGRAKMINSEYVKDGAVVLDVGINRDENNKRCGDVDFEDVKDKVYAITPVPGGIGPMTITMLLQNTLEAFYHHQGE